MARRNEKYTQEMKERTAAYILETGKSATKTAKESKPISVPPAYTIQSHYTSISETESVNEEASRP